MATFNGARFLDQQIESILRQSLPPVRLLVADDGSQDGTLQLLKSWQKRSEVPIHIVLSDGSSHLGSCRNFERLLEVSEASFVMLADQDDVWDLDKAERLMSVLHGFEERCGGDQPLLVHSDLRLIDALGNPLASSFHRRQGLRPCRQRLLEIGMQNVVTGCASAMNRACVDEALPFPGEVVLHDWWLALVAAQAGGIAYLPDPSVSYRQHGTNVVGAQGWVLQMFWRCRQVFDSSPKRWADRLIGPGLLQLRACLLRFGQHDSAAMLQKLWSRSRWVRLQAALSLGLRKHGALRTIGFYVALLCWQPELP